MQEKYKCYKKILEKSKTIWNEANNKFDLIRVFIRCMHVNIQRDGLFIRNYKNIYSYYNRIFLSSIDRGHMKIINSTM